VVALALCSTGADHNTVVTTKIRLRFDAFRLTFDAIPPPLDCDARSNSSRTTVESYFVTTTLNSCYGKAAHISSTKTDVGCISRLEYGKRPEVEGRVVDNESRGRKPFPSGPTICPSTRILSNNIIHLTQSYLNPAHSSQPLDQQGTKKIRL